MRRPRERQMMLYFCVVNDCALPGQGNRGSRPADRSNGWENRAESDGEVDTCSEVPAGDDRYTRTRSRHNKPSQIPLFGVRIYPLCACVCSETGFSIIKFGRFYFYTDFRTASRSHCGNAILLHYVQQYQSMSKIYL